MSVSSRKRGGAYAFENKPSFISKSTVDAYDDGTIVHRYLENIRTKFSIGIRDNHCYCPAYNSPWLRLSMESGEHYTYCGVCEKQIVYEEGWKKFGAGSGKQNQISNRDMSDDAIAHFKCTPKDSLRRKTRWCVECRKGYSLSKQNKITPEPQAVPDSVCPCGVKCKFKRGLPQMNKILLTGNKLKLAKELFDLMDGEYIICIACHKHLRNEMRRIEKLRKQETHAPLDLDAKPPCEECKQCSSSAALQRRGTILGNKNKVLVPTSLLTNHEIKKRRAQETRKAYAVINGEEMDSSHITGDQLTDIEVVTRLSKRQKGSIREIGVGDSQQAKNAKRYARFLKFPRVRLIPADQMPNGEETNSVFVNVKDFVERLLAKYETEAYWEGKLGVIGKLQIALGYDGSKGKLQVGSLVFLNDRAHTQSQKFHFVFNVAWMSEKKSSMAEMLRYICHEFSQIGTVKSKYHPTGRCELEMWMRGDEKLLNIAVVQGTDSSEYGACHLCDQLKSNFSIFHGMPRKQNIRACYDEKDTRLGKLRCNMDLDCEHKSGECCCALELGKKIEASFPPALPIGGNGRMVPAYDAKHPKHDEMKNAANTKQGKGVYGVTTMPKISYHNHIPDLMHLANHLRADQAQLAVDGCIAFGLGIKLQKIFLSHGLKTILIVGCTKENVPELPPVGEMKGVADANGPELKVSERPIARWL
jgi:hypothetical protein